MTFNPIDLAVIILLLVGFIWGFSKGFIYMIFSLIAIVGGVFAASKLSPLIVPLIFKANDSRVGFIVIFIVVFTLIYFIVKKLTYLFEDMIEFMELEWLDSLVGGVLGLAQLLIIAGILVNLGQGTGLLQLIPGSESIQFAFFVSDTSTRFIDFLAGNIQQIQNIN